jgi:hypothetical protein
MEAGYAHQVGIGHVDKEKTDSFTVTGPARGGKVFPVQLRRENIQPFDGLYKPKNGFGSVFFAAREKEPGDPEPEGDKVEIYLYPTGIKGDTPVQGMIDPGYGDTFRKKHGPVLRQEETPRYRKTQAEKGSSKPFFEENTRYNFPDRSGAQNFHPRFLLYRRLFV